MRSLFEIKNPLPFDPDVFDKMQQTAKDILTNEQKQQYTQAVVLLTSSGKQYSCLVENALSEGNTDEKNLIDKLISNSDTEISFILCLWREGLADIPSYDFRKMLYELNPSNSNAGIFVMTKDGYSVIKLGVTIK